MTTSTQKAPLQESAMLVSLNISQWTARKHDKSVSSEVDRAHGATDAGRFNKLLIDKAYLEPIDKAANAARQYYYKITFGWSNNGDRILPGALVPDFIAAMKPMKSEFEANVRTFAKAYPGLVSAARTRLGSLYNPEDYPPVEDIERRFQFDTELSLMPTTSDFRFSLNEEYVDNIKADMAERMNARSKNVAKECYARARAVVTKISEQCGKEKGKIFDSMIENARGLVEMLPAFNFDNDQELIDLANDIHQMLVPPDRLRQDVRLRADTAKKADAILAKMPWA